MYAICFVIRSVSDPDSIRSVDPDLNWGSGSESGSMQAKIICIKREKRRNISFSWSLNVILRDQKEVYGALLKI
jgi:hypothetical protein